MAERRPRRERDEEVLVWPDLVFVEFIAALLFTVAMVLLAALANAPLQDQANPNSTPNPSKAPWYFLNLQELLLHMNPALAGVIVPTVLLIVLAAIPYYDRSSEGQGVWWGTRNAKGIAGWSALFSFLITSLLVLYDGSVHVQLFEGLFNRKWPANLDFLRSTTQLNGAITWPGWTKHIPYLPFKLTLLDSSFHTLNVPVFLTQILIPTLAMTVLPVVLLLILRTHYRGEFNRRDAMIALFTGFMVVWFETTFVGTALRGQGMELLPPWKVGNPVEWINVLGFL
ncbi:MAG: menaquinol-cytochrome C reductase [Dehalococcoidia bacterium]